MARPRRIDAAAGLLAAALVVACATPVGVRRENPERVHRELTATVLTTGEPSERSLQLLNRFGLRERFETEPALALALLHAGLQPSGDHRRLSGLAELSFYHGERTGDSRYHLAAAVYAYALLFPGPEGETLDASDPRVRLAYDLYNRGLTIVVHEQAGKGRRRFELPFGELEIDFDPDELVWAGHRLQDFLDAANYSVRGFRDRYRRPGIGAPFAAALGPREGVSPPGAAWLIPQLRVPATALLRLDGARDRLRDGKLRGRIEVFTPDEASATEIDGRAVPIEFETTFAIAKTLAESGFFDFELKGFFSGAFRPLRSAVVGTGRIEEQRAGEGLFFIQPYRPGQIPVVLVHGTASSPARWGDLVNELVNERVVGVALPSNLAQVGFELALRNPGNLMLANVSRLPTSIDNMTPGNPFLRTLSEIPLAPGIAANSIIAVQGTGPPERGSDGVVTYASAHIEGVESEFVVRSGHSAQANPEVILEIRRILLGHAATP